MKAREGKHMPEPVLQTLFNGKQLQKARRALGLTERDLGATIGVADGNIVSWEEGKSSPAAELFERLCAALGVRAAFLLRPSPPIPAGTFFRKKQLMEPEPADLSPATRKAVFRFFELCRLQTELEDLLGKRRSPGIPAFLPDDAEHVASQVRAKLGIGVKPIADAESVLFKQGIRIFRLEVPGEEFSGLSVWDKNFGPAILAESRDTYHRHRFTLFHEYGHLVTVGPGLSQATVCDLDWDSDPESFANNFAAAMLVPQHSPEVWSFPEEHPNPQPEDLDGLVKHFSVSREVIARRLFTLKMADWILVQRVRGQSEVYPLVAFPRKRAGWKKALGDVYLGLAREAYKKGYISLGKLAEYLAVDPETALEYVEGQA